MGLRGGKIREFTRQLCDEAGCLRSVGTCLLWPVGRGSVVAAEAAPHGAADPLVLALELAHARARTLELALSDVGIPQALEAAPKSLQHGHTLRTQLAEPGFQRILTVHEVSGRCGSNSIESAPSG